MLTEALTLRRSIYALGQDMPISDEKLIKTVEQCMEHCPTAFNAQSSRVAILLAAKHTQFWKLVADALKKVTPSEKQAAALQRVANFAAAHGTILLFEDADTLEKMQKQFALYAAAMDNWLQQGNAILSYMIWQCLAEQKVGASLQHYGNLVESDVIEQFHLPKSWRLVAQMPFGGIMALPAEKEMMPLSERLKVLW